MTGRLKQAAGGALVGLLLGLVAISAAQADGVSVGSEAEVLSDDGANLRAEASADARVVALVGQARYVYVRSGPKDGWYEVDYDGDIGWLHGDLLGAARPRGTARGDRVATEAEARKPAGAPASVRVGAEAQIATEGGVNLRREPSTDAGVVELVKNARIVYVIDGPREADDEAWFKVEFDGTVGWLAGRFLGAPRRGSVAGSSQRAVAPAAAAAPRPAAPRPSTTGEAIAQRALQYVGSPYAWGGNSPRYGFDCSGLIAYVMGQFGIWPGRTSDTQAGAGVSVTGRDLAPGDIVVFANTYGRGYSHTGIYIGGGRFVHAEDYGTGVVVSSVWGGYWGRHYAGARRLT
jgi:cell wall-associated NlpC family hydrolase